MHAPRKSWAPPGRRESPFTTSGGLTPVGGTPAGPKCPTSPTGREVQDALVVRSRRRSGSVESRPGERTARARGQAPPRGRAGGPASPWRSPDSVVCDVRCGSKEMEESARSAQHLRGGRLDAGASIAADRVGNERGVNVSKRCGFNDVWLCWSFQANFMYSPVLYSPVL